MIVPGSLLDHEVLDRNRVFHSGHVYVELPVHQGLQ